MTKPLPKPTLGLRQAAEIIDKEVRFMTKKWGLKRMGSSHLLNLLEACQTRREDLCGFDSPILKYRREMPFTSKDLEQAGVEAYTKADRTYDSDKGGISARVRFCVRAEIIKEIKRMWPRFPKKDDSDDFPVVLEYDKAFDPRLKLEVEAVVDKLAPWKRVLLNLVSAGYPLKEIAQMMGKSGSSVSRSYGSTRQEVAQLVGDDIHPPTTHQGQAPRSWILKAQTTGKQQYCTLCHTWHAARFEDCPFCHLNQKSFHVSRFLRHRDSRRNEERKRKEEGNKLFKEDTAYESPAQISHS